MKKSLFILLITCIFVVSCDDAVFKAYQELPANRWVKTDIRTFEVEVPDETNPYQLNLELRHANSILLDSIKMAAKITSPSGEAQNMEFSLALKDEHGNFKGEGTVDIWDLCCYPLGEKKPLQKGKYKIEVSQLTKYEYIPGVMGLGIRLDK